MPPLQLFGRSWHISSDGKRCNQQPSGDAHGTWHASKSLDSRQQPAVEGFLKVCVPLPPPGHSCSASADPVTTQLQLGGPCPLSLPPSFHSATAYALRVPCRPCLACLHRGGLPWHLGLTPGSRGGDHWPPRRLRRPAAGQQQRPLATCQLLPHHHPAVCGGGSFHER
jgi:hypothetical protein